MDIEKIISDLEGQIEKVHTQSLDLSFNELLDMHENGELDISPDYQRLFRWTEGTRSRFIESLLLEMPVPPIYVVETDSGVYQLIDGLQRFSSYLHLRGELNAEHMGINKGDYLTLVDCDIVTALNGLSFEHMPTTLKIKLKRSFVRVEIVRKGSDNKFKYHMFKRLNTGGEELTAQQIRNCTIRMLDPRFNDYIIELSRNENYVKCIDNISEEQALGAFDIELVLRYFTFKNNRSNFKHDIADFMTEYMEDVSSGKTAFDYEKNKLNFEKVFLLLNKCHSDKIFGRLGKDHNLQSNFSVYHFESITLGIQNVLEKIDPDNEEDITKLRDAILVLKNDDTFSKETRGGGKNSPGLLRKRIEICEAILGEAFQ